MSVTLIIDAVPAADCADLFQQVVQNKDENPLAHLDAFGAFGMKKAEGKINATFLLTFPALSVGRRVAVLAEKELHRTSTEALPSLIVLPHEGIREIHTKKGYPSALVCIGESAHVSVAVSDGGEEEGEVFQMKRGDVLLKDNGIFYFELEIGVVATVGFGEPKGSKWWKEALDPEKTGLVKALAADLELGTSMLNDKNDFGKVFERAIPESVPWLLSGVATTTATAAAVVPVNFEKTKEELLALPKGMFTAKFYEKLTGSSSSSSSDKRFVTECGKQLENAKGKLPEYEEFMTRVSAIKDAIKDEDPTALTAKLAKNLGTIQNYVTKLETTFEVLSKKSILETAETALKKFVERKATMKKPSSGVAKKKKAREENEDDGSSSSSSDEEAETKKKKAKTTSSSSGGIKKTLASFYECYKRVLTPDSDAELYQECNQLAQTAFALANADKTPSKEETAPVVAEMQNLMRRLEKRQQQICTDDPKYGKGCGKHVKQHYMIGTLCDKCCRERASEAFLHYKRNAKRLKAVSRESYDRCVAMEEEIEEISKKQDLPAFFAKIFELYALFLQHVHEFEEDEEEEEDVESIGSEDEEDEEDEEEEGEDADDFIEEDGAEDEDESNGGGGGGVIPMEMDDEEVAQPTQKKGFASRLLLADIRCDVRSEYEKARRMYAERDWESLEAQLAKMENATTKYGIDAVTIDLETGEKTVTSALSTTWLDEDAAKLKCRQLQQLNQILTYQVKKIQIK